MSEELPHSLGFPPIADNQAQALILGSMPSVTSLDHQQYYGHPRNAFWPIMTKLLKMDKALNYSQHCQQLIRHRIAVWDVLQSCQRQGSLDTNIDTDSMVTNDFNLFLLQHPHIKHIFFNGAKAEQVFNRHILPTLDEQRTHIARVRLPSTSPAHASLSLEQKYQHWQQALASINSSDDGS